QSGLYRFIRHPSYTGSLICFLGMGLSYSNYLSLLLMFFAPLLALVNRIGVEEKVLNKIFGQEYADYVSRTKKLLPGIY
ncbi:MAG TPA: isoprenylcysteine carboxylmethyltransferase family protein, partial [Chroococcales cyanobacterium]